MTSHGPTEALEASALRVSASRSARSCETSAAERRDDTARGSLQHAIEGIVLEQVARLERRRGGIAGMPAELLEPGGMYPAILGGVHRAALERNGRSAPPRRTRRRPEGLQDPGDGAGIDRLGADHQGRRPVRRRVGGPRRRPDAAEHRPLGDARRALPARSARTGQSAARRRGCRRRRPSWPGRPWRRGG